MSPTGLGWGRKLLTREMLHMPSRYCWAWMVTELSAPLRAPPPTVTWTLGLELDAQLKPLRCSATGTMLWAGWGILDVGGLEERVSTPCVVTLVGCPGKVLEGRVGTVDNSVPQHRSWRACKACCLNCCMGVAQTGHLVPSCPPWTGQSGSCSWSKRKAAKPGSFGNREEKTVIQNIFSNNFCCLAEVQKGKEIYNVKKLIRGKEQDKT